MKDQVLTIEGSASQAQMTPKSRFTEEVIDDIFSHHPPTPEQRDQYERIREGARQFARILVENTPASADQTTAIRGLREVVMIANASVALGGKY